MLEAIVIIIALGGLEIALWWADHKRQHDQLETLEAIWVELALLNEGNARIHPGQSQAAHVGPTPEVISIPLAEEESIAIPKASAAAVAQ
jgi:hypothetical protein